MVTTWVLRRFMNICPKSCTLAGRSLTLCGIPCLSVVSRMARGILVPISIPTRSADFFNLVSWHTSTFWVLLILLQHLLRVTEPTSPNPYYAKKLRERKIPWQKKKLYRSWKLVSEYSTTETPEASIKSVPSRSFRLATCRAHFNPVPTRCHHCRRSQDHRISSYFDVVVVCRRYQRVRCPDPVNLMDNVYIMSTSFLALRLY